MTRPFALGAALALTATLVATAHAHEHPNYIKIWGILLALLCVSIAGPMLGIKVVTLITAFGIAIVRKDRHEHGRSRAKIDGGGREPPSERSCYWQETPGASW